MADAGGRDGRYTGTASGAAGRGGSGRSPRSTAAERALLLAGTLFFVFGLVIVGSGVEVDGTGEVDRIAPDDGAVEVSGSTPTATDAGTGGGATNTSTAAATPSPTRTSAPPPTATPTPSPTPTDDGWIIDFS